MDSKIFSDRIQGKSSDACSHKDPETLDALNDATAQTTNTTIINATTNTGKALQLPIAINKYLPQLNNTNCKRNHATNNFHQHQLESNKLSIKCPCSSASVSASASASLANKISANAIAISTANIQNIQTIKSINNDTKSMINSTGKELSDICLMCEPNRCIKKESISCDSINKSMYLSMIESASNESLNDSPSDALHFKCQDKSINSARSPKLSPHHGGGSMLTVTNCAQSGTSSACNSPMISLSKSETNISETNSLDGGGGGSNKFTIYNVVSLNDLYESDPFLNRHMNDLSKNQCLTKISDTELDELNQKKNIMTFTNPKVLTTITVSMRNATDGSDKIF